MMWTADIANDMIFALIIIFKPPCFGRKFYSCIWFRRYFQMKAQYNIYSVFFFFFFLTMLISFDTWEVIDFLINWIKIVVSTP